MCELKVVDVILSHKIVLIISLSTMMNISLLAQIDTIKRVQEPTKDIKYEIINHPLKTKKLDFNTDHYKYNALFCRLEEKMFAKSKRNVRFRLGSLDYVNKLELK